MVCFGRRLGRSGRLSRVPELNSLRALVGFFYLQTLLALAQVAGAVYLHLKGPKDYIAASANIATLVAAGTTLLYPIIHQAFALTLKSRSRHVYTATARAWRRMAVGYLILTTMIWTIASVAGLFEATRSTLCTDSEANRTAWRGINHCKIQKALVALSLAMICTSLTMVYFVGGLEDAFQAGLLGITLRLHLEEDDLTLTDEPKKEHFVSYPPAHSTWPLYEAAMSPTKPPPMHGGVVEGSDHSRDSWLPPMRSQEPPWGHPALRAERRQGPPSNSTSQVNLLPSPFETPMSFTAFSKHNSRLAYLQPNCRTTVSSSLYSCPTPPAQLFRQDSRTSYFSGDFDDSTVRSSSMTGEESADEAMAVEDRRGYGPAYSSSQYRSSFRRGSTRKIPRNSSNSRIDNMYADEYIRMSQPQASPRLPSVITNPFAANHSPQLHNNDKTSNSPVELDSHPIITLQEPPRRHKSSTKSRTPETSLRLVSSASNESSSVNPQRQRSLNNYDVNKASTHTLNARSSYERLRLGLSTPPVPPIPSESELNAMSRTLPSAAWTTISTPSSQSKKSKSKQKSKSNPKVDSAWQDVEMGASAGADMDTTYENGADGMDSDASCDSRRTRHRRSKKSSKRTQSLRTLRKIRQPNDGHRDRVANFKAKSLSMH